MGERQQGDETLYDLGQVGDGKEGAAEERHRRDEEIDDDGKLLLPANRKAYGDAKRREAERREYESHEARHGEQPNVEEEPGGKEDRRPCEYRSHGARKCDTKDDRGVAHGTHAQHRECTKVEACGADRDRRLLEAVHHDGDGEHSFGEVGDVAARDFDGAAESPAEGEQVDHRKEQPREQVAQAADAMDEHRHLAPKDRPEAKRSHEHSSSCERRRNACSRSFASPAAARMPSAVSRARSLPARRKAMRPQSLSASSM